MLGGAALCAASSIMRYDEQADLDTRLVEVRLPVRPDLPSEMLQTREGARRGGRYPTRRDAFAGSRREIVTDVHVMRIGGAYIIGLPGEVFVEYSFTNYGYEGGRFQLPGGRVWKLGLNQNRTIVARIDPAKG